MLYSFQLEIKTPAAGASDSYGWLNTGKGKFPMSSAIIPQIVPAVSSAPIPSGWLPLYRIGQAVTVRNNDSFNGMTGTIARVLMGPDPAYYVQLNTPEYRNDFLFFETTELVADSEPEPVVERPEQPAHITEAPTAAESWGDEADVNHHDDVPEWAGVRA
jgi:hypothetical protein